MWVRRTNEERSQATRREILEAARKLFAEQGYQATSLAQITEQAGVTTGAVYHHWANKRELFAATVEQVHADLRGLLGARPGAGEQRSPAERLKASGAVFLRRCADPTVGRILLVDGPSVLGQQRWRDLDQRWWREPTVALLREAASPRRLATGELDAFAAALLGALTALGQEITIDPRRARVHQCQRTYRRLVDAMSTLMR